MLHSLILCELMPIAREQTSLLSTVCGDQLLYELYGPFYNLDLLSSINFYCPNFIADLNLQFFWPRGTKIAFIARIEMVGDCSCRRDVLVPTGIAFAHTCLHAYGGVCWRFSESI